MPDALIIPDTDTYLIWTRAEYDLQADDRLCASPATLKLKDQMYMRPRLSEQGVTYPAPP